MCGYCCGATPIEKRGEWHRNCSENCYNAPITHPRMRAELAEAKAEVQRLRERVEAVERLVTSPEANQFRDEAARGSAKLPYASNRYLRLVDDLRRVLAVGDS